MRKIHPRLSPFTLIAAAFSYAATVSNPIIWADVPDVSMLRVDSTYYMVSTTMHFAPGVPIMASTDLANWRTVNYAYSTLTNSDAMNLNAGNPPTARIVGVQHPLPRRHHYILTPSYTTGKTHLYKTKDIKGNLVRDAPPSTTIRPCSSTTTAAPIFYGSGSISYVQLNSHPHGDEAGGTLNLPLDATTGTNATSSKWKARTWKR